MSKLKYSAATQAACDASVAQVCPNGADVSMHIRGGDAISRGIPPRQKHFLPHFSGCVVAVSDEQRWVSQNLPSSVHFIRKTPAIDMCVAGSGRKIVLTAGTFDVFAAYFRKYRDAEIVMDRQTFRLDIVKGVKAEQALASYVLKDWVAPNEPTWRQKLLKGCGDLCDYTGKGPIGACGFMTLRKAVDCKALFANAVSDKPSASWPPPRQPPPEMLNDYSMGGRLKFGNWYFAQKYSGGNVVEGDAGNLPARENVWTREHVDNLVAKARAGTLPGTYGRVETNNVITGIRKGCSVAPDTCVAGKHIMVIGSENTVAGGGAARSGGKARHNGRVRSY